MNDPDLISPRRPGISARYALSIALLLGAGIPRILAAFFLPNEEGDPYSYLQAIEIMRASIAGGTFTLSELFGFWLPLYQFICALISVVVGHPLYVAKVLSALCGTGVCILVFVISMHLTANRMLSLLAFGLIALNPIHIMYSAFSMSDVPHACLLLGSLYFVIRDRWVLAASLVAMGGLMRAESWLLIAVLPALQFFLHRRVSVVAFLVALSAPLLWIYISWSATGNALEYFNVRYDYIQELLSENPGLAYFSLSHVLTDLRTLFYSGGPAVMIACFILGPLLVKRAGHPTNHRSSESSGVVATASYFFSCLGFLLFAYFTKNQPAIFARYCLVLFALGLPILAWILLATRAWSRSWSRGLSVLLVALCLWQFVFQLRDGVFFINNVSQKRLVAKYLKDKLLGRSSVKVFCDDDTVKVLAGLPADRFVTSSNSPRDSNLFLEYLKKNRVEYFVYEKRERSSAVSLFQDLGEEKTDDLFQLVATTNIDIRLYRTVF